MQHIISNFQQIKVMLMVNKIMLSLFSMAEVFPLIYQMQHIISNFQPITEMLRLSITTGGASLRVSASIEIFQTPSETSKFQLTLAVQTDIL
jgi:hypothetical protein